MKWKIVAKEKKFNEKCKLKIVAVLKTCKFDEGYFHRFNFVRGVLYVVLYTVRIKYNSSFMVHNDVNDVQSKLALPIHQRFSFNLMTQN